MFYKIECHKCNATQGQIEEGKKNKLICSSCGAYIKFLGAKEINATNIIHRSNNTNTSNQPKQTTAENYAKRFHIYCPKCNNKTGKIESNTANKLVCDVCGAYIKFLNTQDIKEYATKVFTYNNLRGSELNVNMEQVIEDTEQIQTSMQQNKAKVKDTVTKTKKQNVEVKEHSLKEKITIQATPDNPGLVLCVGDNYYTLTDTHKILITEGVLQVIVSKTNMVVCEYIL